MGRWLSRDPIGPLGGPNVYNFVGNNPINHTDPFGLMYIPCPGGNCGGGGGSDDATPDPAPPTSSDAPDAQPAKNPCDEVRWGSGASATVCDGKGNIVICLNPRLFPGDARPGGGCNANSTDAVAACTCRGEAKAKELLSKNPNACCHPDTGEPLPAGEVNPEESWQTGIGRAKAELAVQNEIKRCLEDKWETTGCRFRERDDDCKRIRRYHAYAQAGVTKWKKRLEEAENSYDVPKPVTLCKR